MYCRNEQLIDNPKMKLVRELPVGPLDIVGDIHGEHDALEILLDHLGYSENGVHPENRKLVFVGDFCDRGPDSPRVLSRIQQLVENGSALAILGNHELNLLRNEAKEGTGWFFESRTETDGKKFGPFMKATVEEKNKIVEFLKTLPIALEREDLRIVHAAWIENDIATIRCILSDDLLSFFNSFEQAIVNQREELNAEILAESNRLSSSLEDRTIEPPFLCSHAKLAELQQMNNPIKILTSGVERCGTVPFYSSGRWRFVERIKWWKDYDSKIPVIVGHYWRRSTVVTPGAHAKGDPDMFQEEHPLGWHGKRKNVFCIDYSVGGRSAIRRNQFENENTLKLAALRWPERVLVFDDGSVHKTIRFNEP
jgi:hypothetical protein